MYGSKTVSYTHLDVYKRQWQKRSKPGRHLDTVNDVRMTRTHKIEACIAVLVAVVLTASVLALIRWERQKAISLRGAVLLQDSDPRKQLPIMGVAISAGDLAASDATSDSSGFFVLNLRKPIRKGHAIVLSFRNPQYRPLDLHDFVSNRLYVVHLAPLSSTAAPDNKPQVKVANVRVRYTVKALTDLNVGSAVKTFEIENKGNVPCKSQHPCSPDGKWKAAVGSATLDAGAGNEFRDARASCIAGPCPFTRVETDHLSQAGQNFTVLALDWSDTCLLYTSRCV